MFERIFVKLLEFFLFIWVFGLLRAATAATAVAIVTITVLKPVTSTEALSVYPSDLDMTGRTNGELSIINHSGDWHEVRIELIPLDGDTQGCQLLFSPSLSSISPRSTQIVRVLIRKQGDGTCRINHKFIITDARDPGSKTVEVPMSAADNS